MTRIKITTIVLMIICGKSLLADTICGEWQTYNDEKCLKIFSTLQTYDEAVNTCIQYNSTLVTISSLAEQSFIENYLFTTNKVIENVWTGLKYTDSKYKWLNGVSDAIYTNWSDGSPKNKSDYCVQIESGDIQLGKWSDISCSKRNLAFCEKLPTLTMHQLLNMLISTRTQLESVLNDQKATKSQFENTNNQLNVTNAKLEITNNKLEKTRSLIDNFFSNKWIHFKTFVENNTRKALIYPFKTQSRVLRSEALDICHQNNATLVDIESLDKQKLVESFLYQINNNLAYNHWDYWIGGSSELSGKYKWLNSGHELMYTNWGNGQPVTNDPYLFLFSHCNGCSNDGVWVTASLTYTCNVFCEITV